MSRIACAHEGCAHIIELSDEVEARCRQTHESFTCPSGHRQSFTGKTAAERRVDELEAALARAERMERSAWDCEADARAEARTCQWPGCREHAYSDQHSLRRHMRRAHGMPTDAEWEAAHATSNTAAPTA